MPALEAARMETKLFANVATWMREELEHCTFAKIFPQNHGIVKTILGETVPNAGKNRESRGTDSPGRDRQASPQRSYLGHLKA